MNSTMVTISWIVTVIFAIILLITWSYAAKIQTPYGSPASSLPNILGMLIGNGLIPGILWLITYFTAPKINGPNNKNSSKGGYNGGHNNSNSHIMNGNIPSFTNSNLKENTNIYHIQENGSTSEPITYNQLQAKNITKDTYVWRKGLDWTKAGDLSELSELFEQNGPPPFVEPKPEEVNDYYQHNYVAQIIAIIILLVPVIIFIYSILESALKF